jgi:tetratricopeptide (TPR) repeat protein
LAAAFAEQAAGDGATVIWTRGWGRAAPAYWPWVEVVRGLCEDVDGDTLRRELGSGADQLLRLAPELGERLPAADPPVPGREDSEIARFTLFDALVALLRMSSARDPVVVVLDDLHAVDEGSLVALDFVSRMLRDTAVLLVVTMHERTPERTSDAQTALANIVRAGRRLVLGGLTRDDVRQIIEITSGVPPAPALAAAVHEATEGNPFFAREIIALLLAGGWLDDPPAELPLPDGVRETIRRRLEPLPRPAIEVLELAAIIGRTFSLASLERASSLHRDCVLSALDEAARLGLVVELAGSLGRYRFGHGLIAETLLADMPASVRMAGHGAVGEALEHVYRGAIEARLPEIAHHFLSAAPRHDMRKAVDYAQRAGERALNTLAYEQAEELFARALEALDQLEPDIPRRAALLLGLGTAQSRAGRSAARATFEAAVAAARTIDADDILARAALGFAPFALAPGYVDEVHVSLLNEALERIGATDDSLRVRLLGALATALYWSDSAPRRAELTREALEIAQRSGDERSTAFALSSAQLATSGPDQTLQGQQWLRRLFALTQRIGETAMTLAARSRHIDVLLELDDLAASDIAIAKLERLAREARDRHAAAFVPLHRARRAALEGRFEDAHRLLAGVAAIQDQLSGSTIPITVATGFAVLAWLQQGPGEIGEHVRAYVDNVPAMPCWRAASAAALATTGRVEEARLELDRLAADDFVALPRDNLWLLAMTLLSECAVALDLPDHALQIHARLAPFAGRNVIAPTVGFLGPVEMWLGILASVARRDSAAREHLTAARVSATRDGARTALTRIAVEEATVLGRDGSRASRERARELLHGATRACEEMGLADLLQRAVGLQARLDQAVPAAVPTPVADVPPQRPGVLRRIGDVWTIEHARRTLHLSDGRGVRFLALLLARPSEEMHSLDLVAAVDGAEPPSPIVSSTAGRESTLQVERARVNVTRAIRATLKRIAGYDAVLGHELERTVRTGTFCVYEPDPRQPLTWLVEE